VAGDQLEAVDAAAAQFGKNVDGCFAGGKSRPGKGNKPLRRIAMADGEGDRHVALVHAVVTGGSADQRLRHVAQTNQLGGFENAATSRIPGQHDRDVRLRRAVVPNQRIAENREPKRAGEESGENQYGGEKGELETGRTPKVQGLFLVRGVLLVEVADRLQALVETLHFGLILRQENAVAGRRRRLALPARRHFLSEEHTSEL